ncbi:MAG: peroxidase family protein, partial [Planctomycetota bacterium]
LTGTEANALDLPRNDQGTALIGDPRNDENIVIAQLHLMFLRFHNAVITDVEAGAFDGFRLATDKDDFEFARRIVRWHYQWIVKEEFLPAVIQPGVLSSMESDMNQGGWCKTGDLPDLPIEFSAAAYRFGHSQVRGSLRLRRGQAPVPLFDRSGGLVGFHPIDPGDTIDWSLFFRTTLAHPQPARKLDTFLARELFDLPFAPIGPDASLASRNLRRGATTFQLSTGEEAHAFLNSHTGGSMGDPLPLHPAVTAAQLTGTPLWFYCLYEAEVGAGKLGKVGGTLVGLTLLRMLHQDPLSYLADTTRDKVQAYEARARIYGMKEHLPARSFRAASQRSWTPFLGPNKTFSMADMIRYVESSEGR